MKYEVLIYAGKEILTALDVGRENIQYISMDGNQSHPADDVNGFYENILDYFNVDDLSELKAGVRIINGGTSKKNIEFFNKKFIKVDDFSLWRTEELLPITVLQKSMIERDSIIKVAVYDRCYKIAADSTFNISVEDADIADKVMTLEDFTLMNNFNGSNFHSNTDEMKELRSQLYEYKHVIDELTLCYRKSEQKVCSLEKTVSELNCSVKILLQEHYYGIGKIIQFGRFNNNPLLWRILDKTDNKLHLITEDVICEARFSVANSVSWHNSELRKWLNEVFYNTSFTDNEKARIIKDNDDYTSLLTLEEANTLLSDVVRKSPITWWLQTQDYSISASASTHEQRVKSLANKLINAMEINNTTPSVVYCVDTNGSICRNTSNIKLGVRPSMYIIV